MYTKHLKITKKTKLLGSKPQNLDKRNCTAMFRCTLVGDDTSVSVFIACLT